jgi:hypothetical protein
MPNTFAEQFGFETLTLERRRGAVFVFIDTVVATLFFGMVGLESIVRLLWSMKYHREKD